MDIFNIPLAYIDPGSGMAFVAWGSIVLGAILSFLGSILFFIKRFFRNKIVLILLIILIVIGIIWGVRMTMQSHKTYPKVVILGMDGLDPNVMDRLLEQGKLPHFARLKKQGSYHRLSTTASPPESVVVWTSFATGTNPAKHGVFDFLRRDPNTYKLDLSFNEKNKITQRLQRFSKGIPFWEITRRYKIPTVLLHMPNTFPPDKVYGQLLSGMGVPDIRGTMGTFSFYTTAKLGRVKDTGGKSFQVLKIEDTIETILYGPRDTSGGKSREITTPLKITIDEDNAKVVIELQDHRIVLKEGQWSQWCPLTFKINPFVKVRGMCRLYLKKLQPDLELYITPINFDPHQPHFPISHPKTYAHELAENIGLYYTQGMPEDTWALNQGRMDEATFLEQVKDIISEREKMLNLELRRFQEGVLFCYFGSPDPVQHMFWRFTDPQHPMYEEKGAALFGEVIDKVYQRMDQILGQVMDRIDEETTLIVLSDHGFRSFSRAVHLNTWLKDNGYLILKDNKSEGGEFFVDVDWSRTKAYSMGFMGIYVNQKGRENQGLMASGTETEQLKQEIKEKLLQFKDGSQSVVKSVYSDQEIFEGPYIEEGPDLIVGYQSGYRSSWQTALGGVPKEVLEDNKSRWSGDHMMDASLVPGVLFVNRKIEQSQPRIIDMAPTVLKVLGVKEDDYQHMEGQPIF